MLRVLAFVLPLALVACKSHRDEPLVEAAKSATRDSELSWPRPIFSVANYRTTQTYFVDKLGFHIDWDHGDPADFGAVSRGDLIVFLCAGCQHAPGAWSMVFTRDVDKLHREFAERGAIIKQPPTNMPWGLREMQIADPDGNVIRIGAAIE